MRREAEFGGAIEPDLAALLQRLKRDLKGLVVGAAQIQGKAAGESAGQFGGQADGQQAVAVQTVDLHPGAGRQRDRQSLAVRCRRQPEAPVETAHPSRIGDRFQLEIEPALQHALAEPSQRSIGRARPIGAGRQPAGEAEVDRAPASGRWAWREQRPDCRGGAQFRGELEGQLGPGPIFSQPGPEVDVELAVGRAERAGQVDRLGRHFQRAVAGAESGASDRRRGEIEPGGQRFGRAVAQCEIDHAGEPVDYRLGQSQAGLVDYQIAG